MKADLHVHTMFSKDGRTTMEQLLNRAEELGIGCIAVTDHNEFKAYDLLKDNGKIIIIPAEEVSSAEGHIVALGIDRQIPPRKSIQETIDLIHEAGGYAFAVHPYRWWSGLGEKNTLAYDFDGEERTFHPLRQPQVRGIGGAYRQAHNGRVGCAQRPPHRPRIRRTAGRHHHMAGGRPGHHGKEVHGLKPQPPHGGHSALRFQIHIPMDVPRIQEDVTLKQPE